jgi:hypothetical protein
MRTCTLCWHLTTLLVLVSVGAINDDTTESHDGSRHCSGPLLSIVAVGRNDEYGGQDFALRAQRWLQQFEHLEGISSQQSQTCPNQRYSWFEVLLCEWNPLAEKPSLVDVLVPPPSVPTRIFSVPPVVHKERLARHAGAIDDVPFLEYHAKNVALRRISSCSEYVLLTNPDALLSREILGWLALRSFSPVHFVRARRVDASKEVPSDLGGEALFDFLAQHAHWPPPPPQGTAAPRQKHIHLLTQLDLEASGDFVLAPASALIAIRGGVENHDNVHHDTRMLCALAASGLSQQVLPFPDYVVFHQRHSHQERVHRSESAWHRFNGRR